MGWPDCYLRHESIVKTCLLLCLAFAAGMLTLVIASVVLSERLDPAPFRSPRS